MPERTTLCRTMIVAGAALSLAALQPGSQVSPSLPRIARNAATPDTAIIRGHVVEATTGRGIPRATVALSGGGLTAGASGVTDEEGAFQFKGLPAGKYSLEAAKASWATARLPEPSLGRRPKPLEVAPGALLDKVTIRLQRASAITGRVVDRFGEPVPGARVCLRPFPFARQRSKGPFGQWDVRTNDIGGFRVAPLAPGAYLLAAMTDVETEVDFGSGRPRSPGGFVAYPAAKGLDDAQPLMVEAGQTVSDVELTLHPLAPSTVSGVVLGTDGKPAAGAMLTVSQMLAVDQGPASGYGSSLRDGTFELKLLPGTYQLPAGGGLATTAGVSPPAGVRPASNATMRLTVTGETIEGLVLQLRHPRQVTGRIVFDGSGLARPPAPADIGLYAAAGLGTCGPTERSVNADFTFAIQVQGERCQLGADVRSEGWYQRSVTHAGRDVTFDGVAVQDVEPLNDVVISFTDRTTRLIAEVVNAKGERAEAFVVAVFPAEPARRPTPYRGHPGLNRRLGRTVGPPLAGHVIVDDLVPGEYLLAALDPADAETAPDLEWYANLEPLAQRVTLEEGGTLAVRLRIVDLPDVR